VTLQRAAAQKSDKLRRPRISLYPKRDQRMETRKAPAGGVGGGGLEGLWQRGGGGGGGGGDAVGGESVADPETERVDRNLFTA